MKSDTHWPSASSTLYLLGGVALLAFAAKLLVIAAFAGPTPYWDQWDGEAAFLYKPYLERNLHLSSLVAPHNEHRILWSRLLALALLEINGRWEPVLQMVANATLHVAAMLMFLRFFACERSPFRQRAIVFAMLALVAVPFGWENTLAGFQSQFYLLLISSFSALVLGTGARAFSWSWWGATLLGVASYFAMASGAITLAALGLFFVAEMVIGRRARNGREVAALLIWASLIVAMSAAVPTLARHEPLKAHSLSQFILAAFRAGAWPVSQLADATQLNLATRAIAYIAFSCLLYAPFLLVIRGWLLAPEREVARDRLVLLGLWVLVQIASLAYGRAIDVLASRYLDLILVGVAVNATCCLYLVDSFDSTRLATRLALAWAAVISVGFVIDAGINLPHALWERAAQGRQQTINVRGFLADANIEHYRNKPFLDVPYPSADRLAMLTRDPTIRSVLPVELLPASEAAIPNDNLLLGGYLAPWLKIAAFGSLLLGIFLLAGSGASRCVAASQPPVKN